MSSRVMDAPYFAPKLSKEDKILFKEAYSYIKNVFTPYFKKEIAGQKFFKKTRFLNTKPIYFTEGIRNLSKNR